MPCLMSHASIPAEIRKARQLPEDLIRLCIGIEDVDDLVEDLDSAINYASSTILMNNTVEVNSTKYIDD